MLKAADRIFAPASNRSSASRSRAGQAGVLLTAMPFLFFNSACTRGVAEALERAMILDAPEEDLPKFSGISSEECSRLRADPCEPSALPVCPAVSLRALGCSPKTKVCDDVEAELPSSI